MKPCFAYTRVSTAKQGEGVSLQEQREAIARYADRHGLKILAWFEEKETAAKRGRAVFGEMLRRLRKDEASAVVIHKIDRSARNLKDWADLGELIDQGVEVHFANESLDLNSRGGRLSADIQAVVAADYIRNLREETRKGFYGRLKQGIYPLPAPLGYLDKGKGEPKDPDPLKAPLVRRLFQLYASGQWSLNQLVTEAARLGLRNKKRGLVSRSGLSTVLNNPFYTGLIKLRTTGETFQGAHQPLISSALFEQVQQTLHGRTVRRAQVHDFLFRKLLRCGSCGYSLIGERQKGHVYYRCHTRGCVTRTVREETLEQVARQTLAHLRLDDGELAYLRATLDELREGWAQEREDELEAGQLQLANIEERLDRLLDAYLDGSFQQDLIAEKKQKLLTERQELRKRIQDLEDGGGQSLQRLRDFLELARSASIQYETGVTLEKRELLRILTSNCQVTGRSVLFTLSEPFATIASRPKSLNGTPSRAAPRTHRRLMLKILKWLRKKPDSTLMPPSYHRPADQQDG